ncbi:MAG: hypothetical protein M1282_03130 [Chloroflexi bacterium]|nr:hypothetical protein [Chloroflexota bacterium]
MNSLLLKVIVTPALIGTASLVGRRWGHSISGWIIALPLTTGPITFFLALTHGASFAATSAAGTVAGGLSQAAFALAYARLAPRVKWPYALVAACLSFFAVTAILNQFAFSLLPLYTAVLLAFATALRLLPRESKSDAAEESLPSRWDIPMRMVIATVFVVLLTGIASNLGPHLTGLIAPFPIFTATLAAFAHHQHGSAAAISVLRGLLMGLFSFASFFFTVAALIEGAGITIAFASAILVVLSLQGVSLWLLQRRPG